MATVNIRAYNSADRGVCIGIFRSNTPRYFDPAELAYLENWLTGKDEGRNSYKDNRSEHFYVLEQDGVVLACGGFYIPDSKPVANMVWGMVYNKHHKEGLGSKLFAYRVQQIKTHYPECSIILDTSQHTFPFFEKQGFKVTNIEKDSYGPGLDRYDMVLNK